MKRKVLVVEDEFIVADNLRQALQRVGYEVCGIAASAAEAEGILKMHTPDIVLLDIRLQGDRTGIDIARKLRADDIAFIYLSANSSQKILEQARSTEPYGFLVKPFRKKDLLIMLDIAWYRHVQSKEARSKQGSLLQKQLAAINNEHLDGRQRLLETGRSLQPHLPFDFISAGPRPVNTAQFSDNAWFRIAYDEYQFIGEQELLTITNMKKAALSVILANTHTELNAHISTNDGYNESSAIPSLQKTLTETFHLRSCLIFPLILDNGQAFHFFFYGRQRDTYNTRHIELLNALKGQLTALAENILYGGNAETPTPPRATTGHVEFRNIIGSHHALLAALDLAAQVAAFNTSVLILGDSGTGKEKLAQAIHLLSPRKTGPYIKINCAAIPATLMESELFGHEKGAFTGATDKRKGRIEQADGGTIFLDEIGELPLDMQVKMLRFLQEKEIQYVGGNSVVRVNVRIIAATNKNLEKEVAAGNFRLDLYYRLNVFPITLPPLRERSSDIEALATFFAEKVCREFNKPFSGIASSMMEEMMAYDWPGNIRELENVIEQSVVLNDGRSKLELKRTLMRKPVGPLPVLAINTLEDVKHVQRQTEREYIISVLKRSNGRIRGANGAAELMNLKPSTLESKMVKLHIKREDFA